VLLSFEESEFYGNMTFLKRGGLAVVNGRRKSLPAPVSALCSQRRIRCYLVDADSIASGHSMAQASNMALLGFFSRFSVGPYSYENILQALQARIPERLFGKNREIMEAGRKEGEGRP
jgi:Pyruvate/2-oxoacid:ferredoxin oxidoreductase gamma subunit